MNYIVCTNHGMFAPMAVVQYHYTAIVKGLSNELHSIH